MNASPLDVQTIAPASLGSSHGPLARRFARAFQTAVTEEGLLGEALRHHFAGAGSLHRAQLALDSGEAVGLSPGLSVSFAVACELLHNASLVHDDLQDRDVERRGRETVWSAFGDEMAINVGDFLMTRAFEVAAAAPIEPQRALDVVGAFTQATSSVIRGQVEDNAFAASQRLDLQAFESIARAKTGPLIALPVRIALCASGATAQDAARATGAFEALGVVYQAQNDVADFIDGDRRTIGSDLRAGRPNLVVGLHQRLVDPSIAARIEAARALLLTRPDHFEAVVAEIGRSPAIESALFYVEESFDRAAAQAEALPAALRPVFERTAERFRKPVADLRRAHAASEARTRVAIEERRESAAIPVHV